MREATPAYHGIWKLDAKFLSAALATAPSYGVRVADAIGRTVRCIHGLEELHSSVSRDELEVYIGRATANTVASRWSDHASNRGHDYGAVLFTCSSDRVERLEGIALKVLRKLKSRELLCVGNANCHSAPSGRPPRADEVALIYMTWTKSRQTIWDKPGVAQIREIAAEVAEEVDDVTKKQVETGLYALKRLNERDPMYWWTP